MNEISAVGHAALWKKHALKNVPSAAVAKVETPHSPPSRTIDNQQVPCSPLQSCASSPDQLPSATHIDTPPSIEMKPFEEQRELPSSPVISLEECLAEKMKIDHVLAERAKLGPFLLESIERPIIDNETAFQESVEAINSKTQSQKKNHSYTNVEALIKESKCYELSHMEVIAIRLYTTAISYVVNRALRNYSVHGIPIPTDFLPYIYTLLNGLAKITGNQARNKADDSEVIPRDLIRYIRCADEAGRNIIRDAHQLGAYVMYPAFTSSSERDLGRTLWNRAFAYRFQIKSETAIDIQRFSVHRGEFEFVFPPGTIFRILKRDGLLFEIEEVIPQRLKIRRAKLSC